MPSIIIRRDRTPAKEFLLEKALTLIGKKADADIRIEDAEGGEERASILLLGEDFVLTELGPANGTLVNGQPVRKHVLKDRDLISIGEYRMTFHDKRQDDKPAGIEDEATAAAAQAEMDRLQERSSPSFRAGPDKKSERVTYAILGAIVVGIFFASYQSYTDRQAAEAQALLVKKAKLEALQKEEEKVRELTRAAAAASKAADAPLEAPATQKP